MSDFSQNVDISNFLRRNHIAVLATADRQTGQPYAAAVFYAIDSHLNIYFLTKDKTTKSRNLTLNPLAALAVYEPDTQRTAQIMGQVNKVNDKDMLDKALPLMSKISKHTSGTETTPISRLEAGEYILYRLAPQSIRLGDYKYGVKDEIFETANPAEESLENY